jgi:hypothetical protein
MAPRDGLCFMLSLALPRDLPLLLCRRPGILQRCRLRTPPPRLSCRRATYRILAGKVGVITAPTVEKPIAITVFTSQ